MPTSERQIKALKSRPERAIVANYLHLRKLLSDEPLERLDSLFDFMTGQVNLYLTVSGVLKAR